MILILLVDVVIWRRSNHDFLSAPTIDNQTFLWGLHEAKATIAFFFLHYIKDGSF